MLSQAHRFMIIPRLIPLRMRSVSDKSCRKHAFHVIFFFFCENRAVYEIMWKHRVRQAVLTWECDACALHAGYLRLQTHSEYVMLIAFPLQKWLHKRFAFYVIRFGGTTCLHLRNDVIAFRQNWSFKTVCGGSTFARNACVKSRSSAMSKPKRL